MDLASQLRASLIAQALPPPSTAFLTSLIAARAPPPPLPSLLATAKARLLACDLSSTASSTLLDRTLLAALPIDGAAAAAAAKVTLVRDVHVQVVDVENLSLSRWQQVEALDALERGEGTRGRQVVRLAATTDGAEGDGNGADEDATNGDVQNHTRRAAQTNAAASATASPNATHRLVLQDHKGTRIFAVELRRIARIGVGKTNMGEKILLRAGTVVSRGIALLTPETCVLLGGKVETWHEAWLRDRLASLREAVASPQP
ncbi:RecQ mediated genome instability protein Rmi1 [Drechmeria coniospora]|uniref:RecQ-mediated genome instability protein 1 n=1 Tax=Drechmeria coniospora TaxID=98403 RepID=A0A151GCA8_DRECN|nr:RecQ mediated genome instability protein Rmi1 [Drechmeria coniospora]KYK54748.1 RecQ mediated genome instability protein Rmi1 [Drechmeria coniospora]ODA76024.1 hypothetical protein RJ55_08306 [Drechmeria coniospora]